MGPEADPEDAERPACRTREERKKILLGPEADPEDAERPACGTREERNPLGTWGQILSRSDRTSHYCLIRHSMKKNTD